MCAGSKKTVEGTAAGLAATMAAWAALAAALRWCSGGAGGGSSYSSSSSSVVGSIVGSNGEAPLGWAVAAGLPIASWSHLAAATALSCLLEGVTTQLDNVFMPLHYCALLCLL